MYEPMDASNDGSINEGASRIRPACSSLLETADEHFYPPYFSQYHWPLHAWALPDKVLKKVYRGRTLHADHRASQP